MPAPRRPADAQAGVGRRGPVRAVTGTLTVALAAAVVLAGCAAPHAAPRPLPPSATPTGPGGGPVGGTPPAEFAPTTVSFLPGGLGFALGLSPCLPTGTTLCPALLRTADGGNHWAALTPPPLLVLTDPARHPLLRADDALHALATDGGPGSPLALTHDGGHSWQLVTLPGSTPDTRVSAVAAAGGTYVVVAGDAHGQRVWTGPAATGTFTPSKIALPGIGTPVTLALAGGRGWLTAGATYARELGGVWSVAAGPCQPGQAAAVSAPTALRVVVVCQDPPAGLRALRHTFGSTDGGVTFTALGGTGGDGYLVGVAAASPTQVTVATSSTSDQLLHSTDGGHTFALSYASDVAGNGQGLYDLGFSDATNGSVVLGNTGTYALQLADGDADVPTTRLLLTTDGGAHWAQAVFAP